MGILGLPRTVAAVDQNVGRHGGSAKESRGGRWVGSFIHPHVFCVQIGDPGLSLFKLATSYRRRITFPHLSAIRTV